MLNAVTWFTLNLVLTRDAFALGLMVAVLGSGAGCKRILREVAKKAKEESVRSEESAAPTLSAPPAVTWKDDEVSFVGLNTKGRFFIRGTSYDIAFSDLPEGATVSANGKVEPASSSGYVSTRVDLEERIVNLPTKDAFDPKFKLDPNVVIEVVFSPTAKVTLNAPARVVAFGLSDMYKKAADTPLTFLGEEPPKEHTIANVILTPEAIGPAKTLKDIDWVALGENQPPRKGKTCTGYTSSSKGKEKGPEKSYPLELIDRKVSVYEVATSKRVESKLFPADERCPMLAFSGAAKSYPSSAVEKSWLRELRTKKR